MAPEKTAIMVLKVDLQCATCYKKVKKLLCKYPEITSQLFDDKANTVTITVVCCNPEKMRDKLCCKAGKAIKSIDIKPKKPKDEKGPKPTTPAPNPVCGYPLPAYPNHATCCGKCYQGCGGGPCQQGCGGGQCEQGCGRPVTPPVPVTCCGQCYQGCGGGPCEQGCGRPVPPPPHPVPVTCSGQCYQGCGGGPCQQGCGRLVPPPRGPCYDGYGYGGHRVRYKSTCDFSEENSSGCSIM